VIRIKLTGGLVALADDADADLLQSWKWRTQFGGGGCRYAVAWDSSCKPRQLIRMHRLLLDAPPDALVDHISGNTLDNRRSNLRLATRSQNQANRKLSCLSKVGLKGVRHVTAGNARSRPYMAYIQVNGQRMFLGYFSTAEEAHQRYLEAAQEHFGQFARAG
jgi:hypothetical protein